MSDSLLLALGFLAYVWYVNTQGRRLPVATYPGEGRRSVIMVPTC